MEIKKDLEQIKKYCYDYIKMKYGTNQNYIRKTKITKNGLFIYGHKVYAPGYSLIYNIHTYISWYESNNYSFINNLLDEFVLDCNRLNEWNKTENLIREEL